MTCQPLPASKQISSAGSRLEDMESLSLSFACLEKDLENGVQLNSISTSLLQAEEMKVYRIIPPTVATFLD